MSSPTLQTLSKEQRQKLLEDSPIKVYTPDGSEIIYGALPHQVVAHQSSAPNFLNLGTRGTGKSLQLRWDAIIRCLLIPNFRALIVRRTMPELRESHLYDIPLEMGKLGGDKNGYQWLSTFNIARFPNGSTLKFRHCETEKDIYNFLSSQYGFIGFDEVSTFLLKQFLMIAGAARAPEDSGYNAVVRASSNPLGVGAEWMKDWFIDKNVRAEDFPDYVPEDFEYIFSSLDDNPFINRKDYEKRLRNMPEHVRRAWLLGEFVIEGSYFGDFRQRKDGAPWHVINEIPCILERRTGQLTPINEVPWIDIYRAVDWGYFPDPAVCLWIAVLPTGRAIVFKEQKWRKTVAADVAKEIVRLSAGMRIVDTYCDPTMDIQQGTVPFTIRDIFEQNGVPLTPATNRREVYGYAINDYLNTIVDGLPKLQIVFRPNENSVWSCKDLVRTIPLMRMDDNDTRKIADGDDHWVVALAYFCMSQSPPSQDPVERIVKPWMKKKPQRLILR